MDKVKKYAKMMIDEVIDAEKYEKMAQDLAPDEKQTMLAISNQELGHKDMIQEVLHSYVMSQKDENGRTPSDMKAVYDFIVDTTEDMERPIKEKLHNKAR